MSSEEKLKTIEYMCETILEDNDLSYAQATCRMVLKSILEVING